ncbi:PIN domain-containing protein [Acinetobacter corruptisaponis]|uniref:PIN domain-containing protein n=1 Tax=Acinetobacter corruptisaponis TaxID=3045147 RepID=A0ABY8S8R1_9GAMM|nr:PIN domain-containing protein [Acinetobacter sp. KCTC 92772]WHP06084.1 PIN domain-containing protein [Acinetobacter sp. KCTC 92772]
MPKIILLDTHIWYWWIQQDTARYPMQWNEWIAQADEIYVSPVSCVEIAMAVKKGRIQIPILSMEWIESALEPAGIKLAPLTAKIADQSVQLTNIHQDPFDRIIIATAIASQMTLLSVDSNFKFYPELESLLIKA